MYTIIGVDIAKSEDCTVVNGVITARLTLDTKPFVKALQKFRVCAIALGRRIGWLKPKQRHVKKSRREPLRAATESNNWRRMHGYAMHKSAAGWKKGKRGEA